VGSPEVERLAFLALVGVRIVGADQFGGLGVASSNLAAPTNLNGDSRKAKAQSSRLLSLILSEI
jgi:hypothetical protein